MSSRTRRGVRWFFVGLLIVLAIGGVSYMVEYVSLPPEMMTKIAFVRALRKMDPLLQRAIASQQGKTVEEALASPYDFRSVKVFIGLLIAYGAAWAIYLATKFFRFVDREEPSQTPTR